MLSSFELEAKATRRTRLSAYQVIVLELARSYDNAQRGGFSLLAQANPLTHSAPGQTRA